MELNVSKITQTEKPIHNNYSNTNRSLDPNSVENKHLKKVKNLDLEKVRIRFDTNPRFYLKEDYIKLLELLKKITDNLDILDESVSNTQIDLMDRIQSVELTSDSHNEDINKLLDITSSNTESISEIRTRITDIDLVIELQYIEFIQDDSGIKFHQDSFSDFLQGYEGTYFLMFRNTGGNINYPGLLFVTNHQDSIIQFVIGFAGHIIKSWFRTWYGTWDNWLEFDIYMPVKESLEYLENQLTNKIDSEVESLNSEINRLDFEIANVNERVDGVNNTDNSFSDVYEQISNLETDIQTIREHLGI